MREDSEAGGTANTNALDQKCVLFKDNVAGARGAGRGRDVSVVTIIKTVLLNGREKFRIPMNLYGEKNEIL